MNDNIAQLVTPLEQCGFLSRNNTLGEGDQRNVADIGLRNVVEHPVLLCGTNPGLDRLGFNRRLEREFNRANGLGLDLGQIGFGSQAIARSRRSMARRVRECLDRGRVTAARG